MNILEKFSKKNLASEHLWRQIFGALVQWQSKLLWAFVLLIAPVSIGLALIIPPGDWIHGFEFLCLNLVILLTFKTCRRLIDVFNLRKEYTCVTWSYITILVGIGLWIIGFVLIFNIKDNPRVATAIGVVGTLLSWIFQDKIKGVVAFLHLRSHNLLKIGDWLMVDKLGVDGEVQQMTLTSVTVYNWDTTTSTIPISALQTEHFRNLQNMMEGRTYGRRMLKTFVLDTGWFRVLSREEIEKLKERIQSGKETNTASNDEIRDFLSKNLSLDEINEDATNAQLFRLYIYHWLMNHKHISQHPRLIVRWMDHKEGGMELQVYAFIVDSSLAAFEWEQSQIIEHIIKSLDWFGLRLYQSPSAYDVSNSNVYLAKEPADYIKNMSIDTPLKEQNNNDKEENNE